MKKRMVFLSLCLFVTFPSSAQAYFDPGTGSMILQALAAMLVTCLVFLHGVRQKVLSFFQHFKKRSRHMKNRDKR